MSNYLQFKLMGSVSRVMLVPGCVPTKFNFPKDEPKRSAEFCQADGLPANKRPKESAGDDMSGLASTIEKLILRCHRQDTICKIF